MSLYMSLCRQAFDTHCNINDIYLLKLFNQNKMRLIVGAAILLTVLTSTKTVNAAHQDNDEPPHQTSSSLLRGTSNNKQHAKQLTAAELFPIYDPLQEDFARTGLDRSLSDIHDSELNLPLSPEVMTAMGEYITKYSVDGNDNVITDTLRALQEQDTHTIADHGGHSEHDYVESTCNADLDTATCINWSEYFDNSPVVGIQQGNSTLEPLADYLESEVKIPCGVCVTLDASPGDDLYNTTIEFGQGLNIVGKLVIPNDAKVHLRTKYVYVQGVLSMPEPPRDRPVVYHPKQKVIVLRLHYMVKIMYSSRPTKKLIIIIMERRVLIIKQLLLQVVSLFVLFL